MLKLRINNQVFKLVLIRLVTQVIKSSQVKVMTLTFFKKPKRQSHDFDFDLTLFIFRSFFFRYSDSKRVPTA
jgi:hypothetical protein